jgi:hypothetical protein
LEHDKLLLEEDVIGVKEELLFIRGQLQVCFFLVCVG